MPLATVTRVTVPVSWRNRFQIDGLNGGGGWSFPCSREDDAAKSQNPRWTRSRRPRITYRRCALCPCVRGQQPPGGLETREHGWPRLDQASAENAHWGEVRPSEWLPRRESRYLASAHLVQLAWPGTEEEGDTCASSRLRVTVRRKTLSPALLASSMTLLRLGALRPSLDATSADSRGDGFER